MDMNWSCQKGSLKVQVGLKLPHLENTDLHRQTYRQNPKEKVKTSHTRLIGRTPGSTEVVQTEPKETQKFSRL